MLYFIAAFLLTPLLVVGTGELVTAWLGTAWWVGLLLGPICCAEFVGGLCFFLWEGNPIPRWLLRA